MGIFKLKSDYEPAGDQPKVIKELVNNLKSGVKYQVLLGVTGSGKTFTIANVIAQIDKPVLVISHNKTLAAQLYNEFSAFFPENAVEYFISYYDYYQPEAYVPRTDTYIAKDSSINDEIDRLKQKTVMSLLTRRDVIVVASVSCIYGAGEKEDYSKLAFYVNVGDKLSRKDILSNFVELLYVRNDINFERGTFRVRGDVIDIYPSYMRNLAIRIELFDDEVDRIVMFDPLTNRVVEERESVAVFPANFFITTKEKKERAIKSIKEELKERIEYFKSRGKLLEAQRIEERTNFDIEMIEQTGTCAGIENYSRHFSKREPGQPPGTLIDYFGNDFLVIIDESHVTLPQLKGMYRGDYSRKKTLVDYGFRLPSALDNRPLKFEELMERWDQVIFVSATPDEFEVNLSNGVVVEQIIRPTGLMEPPVEVKPMDNAVDDLYSEIKAATQKGGKVLITTLTKRMAEDLSEYYNELGLKTKYMHSELNAIERAKIISDLRNDRFDCIIGVNLLREGLDIPEVNLVAILDADKEGFLRSTTSLIQTAGRAARNAESKVIFYANKMTDSMKKAIDEIKRRRKIQAEYNKKHGIEPKTIVKSKDNKMLQMCNLDYMDTLEEFDVGVKPKDIPKRIKQLQKLLKDAVKKMDFESAIKYRDEIEKLKKLDLEV
ncbi:excinuclease ABC subunit UvrB [Hippea maritima]|uniref:UvrABC system protein B n=1 Tax=Hippea maritima (strain ATCC 700847 / DSM 10411 / MH2) TaxID=760142 RepID=F2LUS3_HIPMA|nr:excinuclease ABC subunit UvrB [Hippea maritima]AEA33528.1 UvrABC system protein B [Hippea maritima DSM 10411]